MKPEKNLIRFPKIRLPINNHSNLSLLRHPLLPREGKASIKQTETNPCTVHGHPHRF
jgi:hypothetical protein